MHRDQDQSLETEPSDGTIAENIFLWEYLLQTRTRLCAVVPAAREEHLMTATRLCLRGIDLFRDFSVIHSQQAGLQRSNLSYSVNNTCPE